MIREWCIRSSNGVTSGPYPNRATAAKAADRTNEDGKRLKLAQNVAATRLWYAALGFQEAHTAPLEVLARFYDTYAHDSIVGPLVILQGTPGFLS